jgi:hypothetical protein
VKIRILLLLLLAYQFLGTTAFARLGDSLGDLTARYGLARSGGKDVLMFQTQNWTITVWLINGFSAAEKYQKPGGPTSGDIATLLSVNSQGHAWKEKPVEHSLTGIFISGVDPMGKAWVRDDGSLAFTPSGAAYCLTVKSKRFLDVEAAEAEADKKARQSSLHGF